MQALLLLRSQLRAGSITDQEFGQKRIALIDSLTGTTWTPPAITPKPVASTAPKPGAGAPQSWQLFYHAQNNSVSGLEEVLNCGVDINLKDLDSGNTALMLAAIKGQKHALFFL